MARLFDVQRNQSVAGVIRRFCCAFSDRLFEVAPDVLGAGKNVVAVEVHQTNATSSDLAFDLVLEGLVGED